MNWPSSRRSRNVVWRSKAEGQPWQSPIWPPPAFQCSSSWEHLFSEPAAGSDLAGLRTRAERSGDDWIINGQKICTSGAHFADFGIIVTRTDPDVPKHQGLTFFFLSMKSPGIEVRRIKQISGTSNFGQLGLNFRGD